MTIDEIIQELERTKDYPASDPASDEALDGAIDIIRKYRKIQEIVKKWQSNMWWVDEYQSMVEIAELLAESGVINELNAGPEEKN